MSQKILVSVRTFSYEPLKKQPNCFPLKLCYFSSAQDGPNRDIFQAKTVLDDTAIP